MEGSEEEREETFLDSAALGRFVRNQADTFPSVFRAKRDACSMVDRLFRSLKSRVLLSATVDASWNIVATFLYIRRPEATLINGSNLRPSFVGRVLLEILLLPAIARSR